MFYCSQLVDANFLHCCSMKGKHINRFVCDDGWNSDTFVWDSILLMRRHIRQKLRDGGNEELGQLL